VYLFLGADGEETTFLFQDIWGKYVTFLQSSRDSRIVVIKKQDYVFKLSGASNVPKIEQCQDFVLLQEGVMLLLLLSSLSK
jgi:hypothetical protein